MSLLQRLTPALLLLVSTPLIAEFLLGDFSVREVSYLGIFIPLYGASALFIREMVRRTGRGWKSMLLAALTFALLAEGIVNQTLFNPNYAGAHLLKYGFIPSLGTSFNYAAFILVLHSIWSISVPIALVEGFAGERKNEPWLRMPEVIGVGLLALLGLAGTTASTIARFKYISSPLQYGTVAVLIVLLIFVAFRLLRRPTANSSDSLAKPAPSVWLVLIISTLLSSAFMLWFHYAPGNKLNPALGLVVFLAIDAAAIMAFLLWSRSAGWRGAHLVAAATGAVLTYGWFGLRRLIVNGKTALGMKAEPVDIVGQVILLLALLGLCWLAYKRQAQTRAASHDMGIENDK